MGTQHLERLRHIRGLLTAQGRAGASDAKLVCYSAAGFSGDLEAERERSSDVVLVGVGDLYN